jgi:hypothetical protein
MDIGLILEEVEMAPRALPRIVDRLMLGTALGAGEARARRKANLKVDLSPLRIEGNVNDLPGGVRPRPDVVSRSIL